MTGCGRYPPQPWHKPIAFYSCARLGDPELLSEIMDTDPYFITQDNGAGAPIHFATTYKQLDMVCSICIQCRTLFNLSLQGALRGKQVGLHVLQIHLFLNMGAEINQRDDKGFTPLHRAAYLAHYDGYLEIYEYLLVCPAPNVCISTAW